MTVLIAVASRYGATREIGEALGRRQSERGLRSEVLSFGDVVELADYDAVVLGSGFYAGHWLAEARDWNAIAEWADTVADALSADQGNREERR